jgi:DNA-binding response OmpR family regulator
MYVGKQVVEKSSLTGLRILVVESKRDERDLLTYILESHGAVVNSQPSVHAAFNGLMYHPFDIVFLSINAIQQHELCQKIKACASKADKEIIIIAVAESARTVYPTMAEDLNCDAYISKPLDVCEVVGLVTALAGAFRQGRYIWI